MDNGEFKMKITMCNYFRKTTGYSNEIPGKVKGSKSTF